MRRTRTTFLTEWLQSDSRKPLVIRGARQVGKTWLVRDLAASQKLDLIELNFERRPDLASLFSSNEPDEILRNIATFMNRKVDWTNALLFLDEIQTAPQLLAKLRWFAEDLPELPVIAAGSLLDFALAKHEFSMPVGRISYMYLEPLSFEEFLEATHEKELCHYIQNYQWGVSIPELIHTQLLGKVKEYLIIGGMPEAVSAWAKERNPESVNRIHFDLLATYRDDFTKYNGRLSIDKLEDILNSIPRQLGGKFVYKHANPDSNSPSLKQALDLLTEARVSHEVIATSANGLPLGAEADRKFLKVILLDSGLCCALLGLSLHQLSHIEDILLINSGAFAEQLVGQLLRTLPPPYISPSLYYWINKKKGSEAEVDYLIQHKNQIVPIEVKAGATGTLKSLHMFMKTKELPTALRISSALPLKSQLESYDLYSIPFYLIGQIHRLLDY